MPNLGNVLLVEQFCGQKVVMLGQDMVRTWTWSVHGHFHGGHQIQRINLPVCAKFHSKIHTRVDSSIFARVKRFKSAAVVKLCMILT